MKSTPFCVSLLRVTRAVWSQRSTDFTQRSSLLPLQNSSYSCTTWTWLCKQLISARLFLRLINENQELVNNLLMSDEAHFHVSGFVNKQNFRYWSATNFMRDHFTFPKTQNGARYLHLELSVLTSLKIREKGLWLDHVTFTCWRTF